MIRQKLEPRNRIVALRLTKAEAEKFRQSASKLKMTGSDLIRHAVHSYLQQHEQETANA